MNEIAKGKRVGYKRPRTHAVNSFNGIRDGCYALMARYVHFIY